LLGLGRIKKERKDHLDFEKFWDNLTYLSHSKIKTNIHNLNPANRSSTIFPVYRDNLTCTKILFLSYWIKKHGNSVVVCFTARNLQGQAIHQNYEAITDYKAFTIVAIDNFCVASN